MYATSLLAIILAFYAAKGTALMCYSCTYSDLLPNESCKNPSGNTSPITCLSGANACLTYTTTITVGSAASTSTTTRSCGLDQVSSVCNSASFLGVTTETCTNYKTICSTDGCNHAVSVRSGFLALFCAITVSCWFMI